MGALSFVGFKGSRFLQLARFSYKKRNGRFDTEKLSYLVETPTVVNHSPCTAVRKVNAPSIYALQAVAHHRGTAHTGHYMAFVRDTDDGWCRYNDAKISTATEPDALTSGAYVRSHA